VKCIYTYVPETDNVSRVYSVTAILLLHSVLRVMLFPTRNVYRHHHHHHPDASHMTRQPTAPFIFGL
jgi:hypothetical protein